MTPHYVTFCGAENLEIVASFDDSAWTLPSSPMKPGHLVLVVNKSHLLFNVMPLHSILSFDRVPPWQCHGSVFLRSDR